MEPSPRTVRRKEGQGEATKELAIVARLPAAAASETATGGGKEGLVLVARISRVLMIRAFGKKQEGRLGSMGIELRALRVGVPRLALEGGAMKLGALPLLS